MKTKLTYIISNIDKALPFEWMGDEMQKMGYELHFILLNPAQSQLEVFLKNQAIKVTRITYNGKKDGLKVLWQLFKIFRHHRPDVVHAHLFDACFWSMPLAWFLGIHKRIFTRHYAALHHHYFPKGVKYDKWINFFATKIIAPSPSVQQVLIDWEKVNHRKIQFIPHGFKLQDFQNFEKSKVEALKEKYNTTIFFPVVGVVARYIHLKGIQYIIPAFKKLLEEFPKAKLLLAGAYGDYTDEIREKLQEIPQDNYTEIQFESDLISLYQLLNLYVHVPLEPFSEAFGQTYVEALAAGVPSIFTLSGIAPVFIEHQKNAWVVPSKDSEAIYEGFQKILTDADLREKMIENGKKSVQMFTLDKQMRAFDELYKS